MKSKNDKEEINEKIDNGTWAEITLGRKHQAAIITLTQSKRGGKDKIYITSAAIAYIYHKIFQNETRYEPKRRV